MISIPMNRRKGTEAIIIIIVCSMRLKRTSTGWGRVLQKTWADRKVIQFNGQVEPARCIEKINDLEMKIGKI